MATRANLWPPLSPRRSARWREANGSWIAQSRTTDSSLQT